jgi:hypothetical protein
MCNDRNPILHSVFGGGPRSLSSREATNYLSRYNAMVASCGLAAKSEVKNQSCEPNARTRVALGCAQTPINSGDHDNVVDPGVTPPATPPPVEVAPPPIEIPPPVVAPTPQEPGIERPGTYQ